MDIATIKSDLFDAHMDRIPVKEIKRAFGLQSINDICKALGRSCYFGWHWQRKGLIPRPTYCLRGTYYYSPLEASAVMGVLSTIPVKKRLRFSPEQVEGMSMLKRAGMNQSEIGLRFGCCGATVSKYLKEYRAMSEG